MIGTAFARYKAGSFLVLAIVGGGLASGAFLLGSSNAADRVEMRLEHHDHVHVSSEPLHNVSHYIFEDTNRNGKFDIMDRPLSGVRVQLWQPNGSSTARTSNIHGFTNFTTGLGLNNADISRLGTYTFDVRAPQGWIVTTGNNVQNVVFFERAETRPGIVAASMPEPVGLARVLAISGRVRVPTSDAVAQYQQASWQLAASSPSGERTHVHVSEDGTFNLTDIEQGRWVFDVHSDDGTLLILREVHVRDLPVVMAEMVIGDRYVPPAGVRHTVSWDQLTGAEEIRKVPTYFGGLNWEHVVAVRGGYYGGEGYANASDQRAYTAYGSSGYPVRITHASGFDFFGAALGVAWLAGEGEIVNIRAWRGDEIVASTDMFLSAIGLVWFDAEYHNITALELATKRYWQLVIERIEVGLPVGDILSSTRPR